MTDVLNRAGITAQCVVGATEANERRLAPTRLASGEVSALVTCDLFNEGVDLPQVDTILLLRPTQSPVLFQQQIGRGLRLAPSKESCLILDFVGIHRREFRFDRLLSSITGLARRPLLDAVENGFGSLSPGCHIHLHRQTRDQVLHGLQLLVQQNWRRLCIELQTYAALKGRNNIRLATFLSEQNVELEDIFRGSGNSGWTSLKRAAGLLASETGPEEKYFSSRMYALLHFDDRARIHLLHQIGTSGAGFTAKNASQIQLLQMLAYQIDGLHSAVGTGSEFVTRLCANDEIRNEILEISQVLKARISVQEKRIPGLEDLPMNLHGRYGIREILTATGWLTAERRTPFQAGVLAIQNRKVEFLFVTLDKSEGYSERISYHDYAISTERFHWQSQNSASADTAAGRRYLDSPGNGWTFQLFVRLNKRDPYRACGPVTLESAEGSKPMTIYWQLQVPLPLGIFHEFSILRGE